MSDPEVTFVQELPGSQKDQAEQPIRVTSRPRDPRPSISFIPPDIINFFHSTGHRLGLRARNDIVKGADDAADWRDVRLSEQPERVQEMLERAFSIKDDCVFRSDWILRIRSFEAHDREKEWQEEMRRQYERSDYFIEDLDASVGDLSASVGGPDGGIAFGHKRSIRADTIGGANAVRAGLTPDEVLDFVRERKEKES